MSMCNKEEQIELQEQAEKYPYDGTKVYSTATINNKLRHFMGYKKNDETFWAQIEPIYVFEDLPEQKISATALADIFFPSGYSLFNDRDGIKMDWKMAKEYDDALAEEKEWRR